MGSEFDAWWLVTIILILVIVLAARFSVPHTGRLKKVKQKAGTRCPECGEGVLAEHLSVSTGDETVCDGLMCDKCKHIIDMWA